LFIRREIVRYRAAERVSPFGHAMAQAQGMGGPFYFLINPPLLIVQRRFCVSAEGQVAIVARKL
jgi:hypothetical protein